MTGFLRFITFESEIVTAATTIYVDDDNILGPWDGSLANPYQTIQDGVNNAFDGDTVFVFNGTYFENLIIEKSINLTGEDRITTIIDGMDACVVYINSTNWVNITGFTITNGTWGIIIVLSSFVTVQENEIYNNLGNGIGTYVSSNNNYINNIVHDSVLQGFFFSGTPYSENTIIGNIVYNNQAGIHLEDESPGDQLTFWNNSIINNTVYNNTDNGISIACGGRNNFIAGNIVHHNGLGIINSRGGISLTSVNNNAIIGNTVHDNQNGIFLEQTHSYRPPLNNTIAGNLVYNNNKGIRLWEAQDNTFIDNSVFNNNISVYMEDHSTGNEFINCTLLNLGKEEFNLTEDSHAVLLNTTFDKNRVYYGDMLSTLTVKWFMDAHVIYNSGNPVSGAEVWIYDTFGTNNLNGSADSQGWIKWIVVTEYIEQDIIGDHKGYKTYHTPHNGTATDEILWGYANPDPFMDESKIITIVLGGSTSVNLKPGWNLISLPRIQSNPDLKTILQSIEGDYDAVQLYNITDTNDSWKHNHISKPADLHDLNELNHTIGFWIHVTNPKGTTLVIFGYVLYSNQNITLYPGWNLVGYPSLKCYNRTIGLNNIDFGPDVDSIWTYNTTKLKWVKITNEDYFERGRGYWIHSKVEDIWNVPL